MKLIIALVVSFGTLAATSTRAAYANPKVLPFSYGAYTTAPGGFEIEQYVDIVAVRLARELTNGDAESTVVPRYELQTELEYGINDRLEVGLYFVFRQGASVNTPFLRFRGLKQRVRWHASPDHWPVQIAAYGEVAELHDEIELEEKLIVERRFGSLRAMVNLWIEQEWYFVNDDVKLVYNPTAGVTWELHPSVQIGAEYWLRGRFDDPAEDTGGEYDPAVDARGGARHYAGPAVLLQAGEYWLSVGAYVRLDRLGNATAVDDPYGRVWVRAIAGIGL